MGLIKYSQANLPNLRRLFVEARTEAEESAYSRNAVSTYMLHVIPELRLIEYSSTISFSSCHPLRYLVSLPNVSTKQPPE
jgi:uncharacterized protein YqiB (DUF1249 family)